MKSLMGSGLTICEPFGKVYFERNQEAEPKPYWGVFLPLLCCGLIMSLRNEALAVTLNTKITQEIDLCWHSFPILNYLREIQTRTAVKV